MGELGLGKKISYALAGVSLNLANLVISQWLLKLYVPSRDEALVDAVLFSAIFLLGRITDGIAEPLVGYWTDHHRSRRGRRIPFIAFGLVPAALATLLLWTPPFPHESHWLNAVYIFIVVQAFFICWSIVANPYLSLLPEITRDGKERVDIATMQAGFIMLGTVVFAFMGPLKDAFGWASMGMVAGGLTIITFLPTLFAIKEAPSPDTAPRDEGFSPRLIFDWARTTFHNRPFVIYLSAAALYWLSLNMLTLLIPFWIQYVLHEPDSSVALVMAPFLAANVAFFFVFNALSRRFGKFAMFALCLAGTGITMPLLWLTGMVPLSPMAYTQVVMGLAGAFIAGYIMLQPAILADIIDHDEKLTGRRREGIYVGMQAIFSKLSMGISIAVASVLMYAGGIEKPTELGLKLIMVLGGAVSLAAFLVFLRYPIRERDGKAYFVTGSPSAS
ncbi:MAG: MFS transporter [Spirochaetes bacterium]|nr:MAG: MFS transporter [Spirochaetota bacterium]